MAGVIRLIPRTTESAYVYFYRSTSAGQCASNVGRLGYGQYLYVGDYCSAGNMIHEIGHSVGLWHEQSREDRDRYVRINFANIQTSATFNFNQNISNGDDVNAYDFGSIMHYSAYSFSANGLPTIETIPAASRSGSVRDSRPATQRPSSSSIRRPSHRLRRQQLQLPSPSAATRRVCQ